MVLHEVNKGGTVAALYVDHRVITLEVAGGWNYDKCKHLLTPPNIITPPPVLAAVALYDKAELQSNLWELHEAAHVACEGRWDASMPMAVVVRPDQLAHAQEHCRGMADAGVWREVFTNREDAFRWAARTSALLESLRR
jgi:hypothetical protein